MNDKTIGTDDWFTIEQIDNDTFAISEYKHWEETHCYLLCGSDRALLIDTGLGIANIRNAVEDLTTLPVMVATTHVHWDHIGGHRYFKDIAVFELEEQWLSEKFPMPLQAVKQNLTSKPCQFPMDFDIDKYQIYQGTPTKILHDGDKILLGNRQIEVIHTPGHSPGHCCFYEPERKYLYSGDLIYQGCLDAFYPTTDPVLFFQSVKKLRSFSIQKIFPAHHRTPLSADMIGQVERAFQELSDVGKLEQGNGIFDFGEFQIHI